MKITQISLVRLWKEWKKWDNFIHFYSLRDSKFRIPRLSIMQSVDSTTFNNHSTWATFEPQLHDSLVFAEQSSHVTIFRRETDNSTCKAVLPQTTQRMVPWSAHCKSVPNLTRCLSANTGIKVTSFQRHQTRTTCWFAYNFYCHFSFQFFLLNFNTKNK